MNAGTIDIKENGITKKMLVMFVGDKVIRKKVKGKTKYVRIIDKMPTHCYENGAPFTMMQTCEEDL